MRITAGTMTVGILAILVGLVGAYSVRAMLLQEEKRPPEPRPPMQVPLASIDLPAGRTIRFGDIVISAISAERLRSDYKVDMRTIMIEPSQIIGRTLREPIRQGEPFLTTFMYMEGGGPDVTALLKPGYRAYSLQLPPVRGGSVSQGSFVDVIFRTAPRDPKPGVPGIPEVTTTLIENVEVLAVERPRELDDRSASQGSGLDLRYRSGRPTPEPTVTLAVTPEQAGVLRTIEGRGEIGLVTRGLNDVGFVPAEPVTLEKLLGLKAPARPFQTDIYRRTARQTLVFQGDMIAQEQYGGYTNMPYYLPAGQSTDSAPQRTPGVMLPPSRQ